MSLSRKDTKSFFTKNAHPCSNKTSQKTHTRKKMFSISTHSASQTTVSALRKTVANSRVSRCVRMMSLSLRVNFVSFFFLFFLISFLPSFGCNKWTREEGEALWMWSLSLVGCASRVGIDRSDRERRKRERGRRVVLLLLLLLLFYGRFCSLEYRKRRVC